VETWRCPTCLAVLTEHEAKRCPLCHTKLRKRRSAPIVLGETSRLDMQSTTSTERPGRQRAEGGYWNPERPAPVVEKRARRRDIDLNPEPVATFEPAPVVRPEPAPAAAPAPAPAPEPEAIMVIEPEPQPEPVVVVEPAPEPVVEVEVDEPYPFFEAVPEPVAEASAASFLDLTLAEHVSAPGAAVADPAETELGFDVPDMPDAPVITATELGAALDADIYVAVDALHRKARGGVAEGQPAAPLFVPDTSVGQSERSLRLMTTTASNRRRWTRRDEL